MQMKLQYVSATKFQCTIEEPHHAISRNSRGSSKDNRLLQNLHVDEVEFKMILVAGTC
jgi:hypothetical protein